MASFAANGPSSSTSHIPEQRNQGINQAFINQVYTLVLQELTKLTATSSYSSTTPSVHTSSTASNLHSSIPAQTTPDPASYSFPTSQQDLPSLSSDAQIQAQINLIQREIDEIRGSSFL